MIKKKSIPNDFLASYQINIFTTKKDHYSYWQINSHEEFFAILPINNIFICLPALFIFPNKKENIRNGFRQQQTPAACNSSLA